MRAQGQSYVRFWHLADTPEIERCFGISAVMPLGEVVPAAGLVLEFSPNARKKPRKPSIRLRIRLAIARRINASFPGEMTKLEMVRMSALGTKRT